MFIPLSHPSSIIIAGPSRSGKTRFLVNTLKERMIQPFPTRIVIVYSEWQPDYDKLKNLFPNIEFVKGPMTDELYESFDPQVVNLLVLDDQMTDVGKTSLLEKYFVQGSHHRNLTIVLILQNIFEKGKAMRTTSLNASYLVVYKNPRDKGQIGILGRQMFPTHWRQFVEAFEAATCQPYSYMLIDLLPNTPEEFRLRGKILPSEDNLGTDTYVI